MDPFQPKQRRLEQPASGNTRSTERNFNGNSSNFDNIFSKLKIHITNFSPTTFLPASACPVVLTVLLFWSTDSFDNQVGDTHCIEQINKVDVCLTNKTFLFVCSNQICLKILLSK